MGLNNAVGFKATLYRTSFTFSWFSSVRWYVGYHWSRLLDKKLRVELEFVCCSYFQVPCVFSCILL